MIQNKVQSVLKKNKNSALYKLKLKFFFITNFKPNFRHKKNSRFHFCKNFFLFIFFLLYYLNNKKKKINKKNQLKLFNINFKIKNKNFLYQWEIFGNPLVQKFQIFKFHFKVKKEVYLYSLFTKINSFELPTNIFYKKSLKNIIFSFLIFTKFFSHFIILRAPFRDKISKNTFQNQRFYIYLTIFFLNLNFFIFFNKIHFYNFLKQFQNRLIFQSNILFLHSKKIEFYFIFLNFFL